MTEPGRVFISYAWENPQYKENVRVFAAWLDAELTRRGHQKSAILIDFLHSITPPPGGWQSWMYNGIKKAETVLVICSPKYLDSYNKDQEGKGGRGGTYEGSIINQILYNSFQQNTKFYPILPDDGRIEDIPETLQPWWNGLRFPSNNETIFRLLLRENPALNPTEVTNEVKEIAEEIEQENIIIQEIAKSIDPNPIKMLNPIEALVRAFVTLSDVDKISIAKTMGINTSALQSMKSADLDKEILKKVKDQKLIHQLWNEVNKILKFENPTNPFKS